MPQPDQFLSVMDLIKRLEQDRADLAAQSERYAVAMNLAVEQLECLNRERHSRMEIARMLRAALLP